MPKVFTTYANSALFSLLTSALETTAEIKKKYAADLAQADTLEKITAQNVGTLIEEALNVSHHSIFPTFNNGKAPGAIEAGKIISRTRNLRALLKAIETREQRVIKNIRRELPQIIRLVHTRAEYDINNPIVSIIEALEANESILFKGAENIPGPDKAVVFRAINNKICMLNLGCDSKQLTDTEIIDLVSNHLKLETLIPMHPMVFELMDMLFQLIKAAPQELNALVPFFDPKATLKAVQSGILGTLLSAFGSFHIKQNENVGRESTSYTFQISLDGQYKSFDAQQRYLQSRHDFLYQILEPILQRYLAVYGDAHSTIYPASREAISQARRRIESERARFSILQPLTNELTKNFRKHMLARIEALTPTLEDTGGLSPMQSIARKIEYTRRLLVATKQVKKELAEQSAMYNSTSVKNLLGSLESPTLLEQSLAFQASGLDVSYLTEPLPQTIVKSTAELNAVGGQVVKLRQFIDSLIKQKEQEQQMREELLAEQKTALTSLLSVKWQDECSLYMKAIAAFEAEINTLSATSAGEELLSLEAALDSVSVKLDINSGLLEQIDTLIHTAHQSMLSISTEPLLPALEKEFAVVQKTAETLKHSLISSQQTLHKKQAILRTQLDKRHAEQLFIEHLHSADPEKIQLLLHEKNRQLKELQDDLNALNAGYAALRINARLLQTEQKNVAAQKSQTQEKLIAIQKESDTLQTVIDSLSQRLNTNTSQDIQHNQDLLERLRLIRSLLVSDLSQQKIPFKNIDAIIAFDQLLPLLSEDITSSYLKGFRASQESLFKRSPSQDDFAKMQTALLDALDKKTRAIERCLLIIPEIKQHTMLRQKMDDTATQLQDELASIDSQSQTIALRLVQLEEESTNIAHDLHHLTREKELPLKNTQYVLSQFLMMLTEIDQLKLRIELFADNDDYENLSDQVLEIQNTAGLLATQADEIANVIDTLVNPLEYQPTLTIIKQLLQEIDQRIILALEEKRTRWQASVPPLVISTIVIAEEETPAHATIDATKAERQIVAQRLVASLRDYQKKRAEQYKVKDFFTASDKTARDLFITQLETQLFTYAETGNSTEVLQTIQQQFARFPGKKLQPLLHKITADILSFQEEITIDSERLNQLFTALEGKHPQYMATLRALLQRISDMQEYGAERENGVISDLANKLKHDVEQFVLKHGENLPDTVFYQAFARKFHARLHSHDNVMYEEGKNWTHIVTNLALSLLLIPRLIYTKFATGRCSFFFEETRATDYISSIDQEEAVLASQLLPSVRGCSS